MELAGAPQDVIDEARERAAAATKVEVFEIWEDCWDAWMFFVSLSGQWSYAAVGMGGSFRTGLPFDRVHAAMLMHPIKRGDRAQLFADIKVMEAGVRAADRELAAKKKAD